MARQAVMTIFDVQLGLAVHVKAPNGKYIIIDLGTGVPGARIHRLERGERASAGREEGAVAPHETAAHRLATPL